MLRMSTCAPMLLLLLCAGAARPEAPSGLSVRSGVLLRGGKPYRGIGVNYFDAYYRALLKPEDTSYEAGFRELAQHGIPFVRFMAGGFWPRDMKLYQEDRAEYFRRLDALVRSAEKHGIGLIPSLFWNMSTVPDLVGEPCDQWGNTGSRTHAFMREYVREVVTRYRNSPALWGWEFGNEYNLAADLPNASEHRPPVVPDLDTPSSRSARDELTHAMIRTTFAAFAREVRRYDRVRPVFTGSTLPRPSAWHQMHEKSWTEDTPEQAAEMLSADNPNPVNTLSMHAYEKDSERVAGAMAVARKEKKPLFVGEFGAPGPPSPETERQFAVLLAAIEKEGVPLAALWVYDHSAEDPFTVTASGPRAYQLRAIEEANWRLQRQP